MALDLRDALLGTWSLLAWFNETSDGQRIYPLGKSATGYISYSQDGHVFVHMMASDRPAFATNDPFGGSETEDSAAFKSHITYAGRFDCAGDQVFHHVTQASCPNWIGSTQVRDVAFLDDRLRLSAAGATFQGQSVTAHVDWERAQA